MAAVDSGSEEDSSSEGSGAAKRRRLSVPSSLQGLFARAEDPEEHGGRKRRVPHVEGNYPTLVFIPVARTRAWRRACERCQALLSRLAPGADVASTDPEVGAGWHVSLAPLMMLRRQVIQPFEERLRKLTAGLSVPEGVQEDIWFNESLEVFSSAEGDRYFAGVSAAPAAQRWLRPLAAAVAAAARELGVTVPSHDSELLQLHCSLAWTVSQLEPALLAAGATQQESPWGRRWTLDDTTGAPLKLHVKGLLARIGDRTSTVAFSQLQGIPSDEESESESAENKD